VGDWESQALGIGGVGRLRRCRLASCQLDCWLDCWLLLGRSEQALTSLITSRTRAFPLGRSC
jgi:hypothetical protein